MFLRYFVQFWVTHDYYGSCVTHEPLHLTVLHTYYSCQSISRTTRTSSNVHCTHTSHSSTFHSSQRFTVCNKMVLCCDCNCCHSQRRYPAFNVQRTFSSNHSFALSFFLAVAVSIGFASISIRYVRICCVFDHFHFHRWANEIENESRFTSSPHRSLRMIGNFT